MPGYPDTDTVRVFLNHLGRRLFVGLLAYRNRVIHFQYDTAFLRSGIPLSPYVLPLENRIFVDPKQTFDGLFGVFNDSLPDGWGIVLLSHYLAGKGLSFHDLSPLQHLCLVGSKGPGALEYEPDLSSQEPDLCTDLDTLAQEAGNILAEKSCQEAHLEELVQAGGALSGARPKICLRLAEKAVATPWIVKFRAPNDPKDMGLWEYQCAVAARKAGINMPDTRLLPSQSCPGHFAIRRFDRKSDGKEGLKVHTHTICGLLHASHTIPCMAWEDYLRLTSNLTRDVRDVEEMVRRMIFCVRIGNGDDHTKNFSFVLDADWQWHLAPAYDLVPCKGPAGEHWATVNGQGRRISDADLVEAARAGGIKPKRTKALMEEIDAALRGLDLPKRFAG